MHDDPIKNKVAVVQAQYFWSIMGKSFNNYTHACMSISLTVDLTHIQTSTHTVDSSCKDQCFTAHYDLVIALSHPHSTAKYASNDSADCSTR